MGWQMLRSEFAVCRPAPLWFFVRTLAFPSPLVLAADGSEGGTKGARSHYQEIITRECPPPITPFVLRHILPHTRGTTARDGV